MTALDTRQPCRTTEPAAAAALVVDPLGTALDVVAERLRVHCLVEAENGAVVGHCLSDDEPPAPLAQAVLRRDAGRLTSTLRGQRSVGLLPGGPLITARLPGWSGLVHSAALVRAGQRLGWLWLLAPEALPLAEVAAAAGAVGEACPTLSDEASEAAVRGALDGSRSLPTALVGASSLACVVTVLDAPPADVRFALATARRSMGTPVAMYEECVRAVLLADTQEQNEVRLRVLVEELNAALGVRLRVGVSEPAPAGESLGAAAVQADAAARACAPGQQAWVREVRAKVVLEHARASLADLPDLGPDPVELLREHDRRRSTELARTVRCWLDADGDVTAAAATLVVHPNTLRYRLRCAQTVAGVSFEDLSVRLELHLRLGT